MNKKTIDGVRKYYRLLPDVSDEQIVEDLKGSFGEAVINLEIAKKDLIKAFGEVMPKVFQKYFRK